MGAITIFKMSHPRDVSTFVRMIQPMLNDPVIDIYFKEKQVFPAAFVPICGINLVFCIFQA